MRSIAAAALTVLALAASARTAYGAGPPSETPASRVGFSLDLDRALPVVASSTELAASTSDAAPVARLAARGAPVGVTSSSRVDRAAGTRAITLRDIRQAAALHRQDEPDPAGVPVRREGGFGRWLRRHWWVPVLVAGAVALAVQDDSPDAGEDDD